MGASPPLSRKAEYLLEELNKEYVEIENIREICFTGVPDDSYKRDVVWKILLNYLPARRADWPTVMKEKRQLYRDYMNLFIVQPGRKHRQNQVGELTLICPLKTLHYKQDGLCESVHSTECSNMPLKVAKTTFKFCQRKRCEYPKPTYKHWRKLLELLNQK